jgi:DNA processing protein
MMAELSLNTQAALLLTAPLILGRAETSDELLTPGEYRRLAARLRELQRQPGALLTPEAGGLLQECRLVVDEERLRRLLGRGFLLGQALERWQARSIWVVSLSDPEYPRRLKARLREEAPPVLYGCGGPALLEGGGLAIVGSRHADEGILEYALKVAQSTARAGRAVVSGGARGVDQAAMRGALEAGGAVAAVLADSLERAALHRDHRELLREGQLVLISPYDPLAGFNVGNAMRRNKLIYALADAALVVSSDLEKGGTWAGATEQLSKRRWVPVYVRSNGAETPGLRALRDQGALVWPDPQTPRALEELLARDLGLATAPAQQQLLLIADDEVEPEPEPARAVPGKTAE